jgi:hypothetical protein
MANSPALYQLSDQYLHDLEALHDSDLPDVVVQDTLAGLAGELEDKATAVAMFARNLEAAAEAIKLAEGKMAERRRAMERRADAIRKYLKDNMERTGISRIECPYFTLKIARNPPAVVVDDAHAIPADFWVQPPPPPVQLDKKQVAATIKAGAQVPGAHLEQGTRLVIE